MVIMILGLGQGLWGRVMLRAMPNFMGVGLGVCQGIWLRVMLGMGLGLEASAR